MSSAAGTIGLKRDAVGLLGVVYQGITHIAPAANVLFGWAFIASFAGAAMPISLLISIILCYFIANTVAEFSRYTPSAGGYYTFVTRGLGPRTGYITTWAYFFYDWVGPAGTLGYLGVLSEAFLKTNNGIDIPWWIYSLVAVGIVWVITYFGISISSRTTAILGTLELLIMTALGISFLLHPAPGASFSAPFNPSSAPTGLNGIILGMIFSLLALSGFEAAAPLAEEAQQPTKNIRKAIMWSLFAVGIFYLFSTYSTAIGFGTSQKAMTAFGSTDVTAFYTAAKGLWHTGWILIFFAIINSCLGVGIACTNAATRVMYTMGKAGTLPAVFATIHPKYKTPSVAIHVQQILGIIAFVAAALIFGSNWIFGFLGTATTVALIVLYGLANVALIKYIQDEHPTEFNLWRHAIMPVIGTLMLLVVLYKTITTQAYPTNWAVWVVVAWLIIGAGAMFWVSRSNPGALERGTSQGVLPIEELGGAAAKALL